MAVEHGLVDGIGGVFLFSNDPVKLAAWYERHFGMKLMQYEENKTYGLEFVSADSKSTVFTIQKRKDPLPEGVQQQQKINFRVLDLGATVKHLVSEGSAVGGQREYDFGKFAWVKDAEGNHVELWQPM